jgi:hypothetical protein
LKNFFHGSALFSAADRCEAVKVFVRGFIGVSPFLTVELQTSIVFGADAIIQAATVVAA